MFAASTFFGAFGFAYVFLAVVAVLQLMCMMFIPAMLRNGASAANVGKAIYCYLAETIGITLMAGAALPAVYGVLARQSFSPETYIGLLFVFAFGGFTFLWHDFMVRSVDAASRSVPHAVHFYLWKLIGFSLLLLGTLSLLLRLIFADMIITSTPGWAIHGTAIFFGFIVSWCTSHLPEDRGFSNVAVHAPNASHVKKPVKKKKK